MHNRGRINLIRDICGALYVRYIYYTIYEQSFIKFNFILLRAQRTRSNLVAKNSVAWPEATLMFYHLNQIAHLLSINWKSCVSGCQNLKKLLLNASFARMSPARKLSFVNPEQKWRRVHIKMNKRRDAEYRCFIRGRPSSNVYFRARCMKISRNRRRTCVYSYAYIRLLCNP